MKTIRKVPLPANHPSAVAMVKDLQRDMPGIKYGDKCPCGVCRERFYAYLLSDEEYELLLTGRARIVPILGN